MPTGDEVVLLDTSAAVPLVVSVHEQHSATVERVGERRVGLAGHAAFETFSVLTRLPPPLRRSPAAIARLLNRNFAESRFLSAEGAQALLERLTQLGISGGAVYDALVGAAAAEHDLALLTRDQRAADTYRVLDVRVELLA